MLYISIHAPDLLHPQVMDMINEREMLFLDIISHLKRVFDTTVSLDSIIPGKDTMQCC